MADKQNIILKVKLDEKKLPEEISWSAGQDNSVEEKAKAFLLSIWDHNQETSLKIDLWTKDMYVEEMNRFLHQTLLSMAETMEKATQQRNLAEDLRDYCAHFAEKTKILNEAPETTE